MLKYVAEGVLPDIEKLLNDFVKANTVEFSVFATLWRKHNLSLIFLGRSDEKELIEFTHESFRIASRFLVSSSHLYQVGGLYVLYGLFRNQPSIPPIRARIQLCHWKNITKLCDEAEQKKLRSLHYVIDYMIDNGFDFVSCQTLMGPRISSLKSTSKLPPKISQLMATLRAGMTEFKETKSLEELDKMYNEYLDSKSGIHFTEKVRKSVDNKYEYFISEIDKLLSGVGGPSKNLNGNNSISENIGSRRAHLKAAQFAKKSAYRRGVLSDSDVEIIEDEPVKERKPIVRKKRVPKEEKRVGRPRIKPRIVESEEHSEGTDDTDNNELLMQQTEKYLPESKKTGSKRNRRPIRKRFYYEDPNN